MPEISSIYARLCVRFLDFLLRMYGFLFCYLVQYLFFCTFTYSISCFVTKIFFHFNQCQSRELWWIKKFRTIWITIFAPIRFPILNIYRSHFVWQGICQYCTVCLKVIVFARILFLALSLSLENNSNSIGDWSNVIKMLFHDWEAANRMKTWQTFQWSKDQRMWITSRQWKERNWVDVVMNINRLLDDSFDSP